jgi:TolA-binding protein
MDAVTYPNMGVISFFEKNMVAVRIPSGNKSLMTKFNINWTPTLVTLDSNGKEHHRTVGFMPPDEIVPSLLLGIAKSCFETEQFAEAIKHIKMLLDVYSESDAAPEATFLLGVCRYKDTHNPAHLKEAYEQLSNKYPESEWTKRADPYRLL